MLYEYLLSLENRSHKHLQQNIYIFKVISLRFEVWRCGIFQFGFPFKGSFLYMYSRTYILIPLGKKSTMYSLTWYPEHLQYILNHRMSLTFKAQQLQAYFFHLSRSLDVQKKKSSHQVWDVYKYGGYDLFWTTLTKLEHLPEKF